MTTLPTYRENLLRYRVRVVAPPSPGHPGYVVWAASEAEARQRVEAKGHRVDKIEREELSLTGRYF